MKIVKCKNVRNHFYDSDKYESCPHCSKNKGSSKSKLSVQNSVFNAIKSVEANHPQISNTVDSTQLLMTDDSDCTQLLMNEDMNEVTQILSDDNSSMISDNDLDETTQFLMTEDTDDTTYFLPNDDTLPLHVNNSDDSAQKLLVEEQGASTKADGIVPITGWLVAVNTAVKGCSYNLKLGNNMIGHGKLADISLDSDLSVTSGVHAVILYNEISRNFFIDPCNGSYLVWLNGQPLKRRAELTAYDNISVGSTELIFIPFCGEKFSWKN